MAKKSPAAVAAPEIKIEYWPVDKPHNYERNARIIPESAVDVLVTSLKEFGFKVPVVVDKDGVIVMGHTRVRAAKKMGMKDIPVIVARDLTPEKIRQLRIMDNRSSQNTSWDSDVLKEELADMVKELDGDNEKLAEMTGFETDEIDTVIGTLAANTPSLDPKSGDEEDEKAPVRPDARGDCKCPHCGFSWRSGDTAKVQKPKVDKPAASARTEDDGDDDAPPAKPKKKRFDLGPVDEE